MSDVFALNLDTTLLERLFGEEDEITYYDEPDEPVAEERTEDEIREELEAKILRIERLKKLLEKIPAKERTMLRMKFGKGLSQSQIGEFFEVSQVTISYRIQRALQRIQVFNQIIDIDQELMRRDYEKLFDDLTVDILMAIFETSNQSETARIVGKSQYCVRSRYLKAIEVMEEIIGNKKEKEKVTQVIWYGEEVKKGQQVVGNRSNSLVKRVNSYLEIFQIIQNSWHLLSEKLHKWHRSDRIL